MLTESQLRQFESKGFFRVESAFSKDDAMPMCDAIYSELERQCGIDRDDPLSWNSEAWPKFHDIKFDSIFEPIGGEKTRAAFDAVLGSWEEPSNWGQFLVSLPTKKEWPVPSALWHTDFGFEDPIDPLPGVLLISFITDVGPRDGGTGAIEGSHCLVSKFVETKDRDFRAKMRRVRESLMESVDWLRELADPETKERAERFMNRETMVEGCPVRVVELMGTTGDIVIAHPWLLHTSSLNCGRSISMRRVQRIKRLAD